MNIIQDKFDDLQEKQILANIYTPKDLYEESQIQISDANLINSNLMQQLEKLHNELPKLEKAINTKNYNYVSKYIQDFSDIIQKGEFDENAPIDCIEFILPYITQFINVNTHKQILERTLLFLYEIISKSLYYSKQFVISPSYQQLLLFIQNNITDYITGISIHILVSLSSYEELHDIYHSVFSIQSILHCFLSDDYQEYSKESFILLLGEYLLEATDDEKISQILSCILKCLIQPNLANNYLQCLLSIVGRFYMKNKKKGIDVLPTEMIQFLTDNIYNIIKYLEPKLSNEIFYLIYVLTTHGIVFYYPVEDIYQIVLDKNTSKIVKDRIIEMLAISIKVNDSIDYSQLYITKSIKDIIDYCLEDGAFYLKYDSLVFIAIILSTENLKLFISILCSPSFINFLDYVEDTDNINSLVYSVGILGTAFHLLQVMIPNSDEFNFFISSILSSNIIEKLSLLSQQDSQYNAFFMDFCALINSESTNSFEKC